ncbi:GumC family protein [Psychroserpens sp.]|uniref:GumC family protein n=1 Tax=Psychroserpens sp. TaxID=2020870 RepID=UPI002B2769E2|nr:polysaccharide biosynthesis tyrosine autokinase [Psychroserpens sp.]
MSNTSLNTENNDLRNLIDIYVSKWKLIAFCVIVALGIAFLNIRYATYEYQASASIKINDDKKSTQLPEISSLQSYGLFGSDFTNITDEIEIIRSRSLIKSVVDDLNLNVKYYVRGRIKDREEYKNPPILINFLASDSIVNLIDTTLYIKIKSKTKFNISSTENNPILDIDPEDSKEFGFGEKIESGFGDFILIPNIERDSVKVGTSIKIDIVPLSIVTEQYLGKINVVNESGSNIINLTVNENLKTKASLIIDKLIEKYNEDVINDKQLIVQATSDFINNRLNLVSNELEQVDFTAETLQKNNRLTALGAQADIFLQSEKENEAKLINTSNQIQLIDYMKDHLDNKDGGSDLLPADVGIADNTVALISKNHNELVLQRDKILKFSTDKNPTVVNLNNQINALRENLNRSLDNIQSANKITLQTLNKEDQRISSQLYSAPTKARQFRDIKRQQDIKESLYLYLLQKREETAIQLGLSSPNAKIIDSAYTASTPVSPKPTFVYLAALMLGLIIPVTYIYGKNILNSKIHTKDDLLKVLTARYIGDIPKESKKSKLIKKVDYSPIAEAFRILRTNIDFLLKDHKKGTSKTIFVTSTTSQEGKSHTSTNLACSFSFTEKRVLLIETDIRVPKVDDYFNIKSDKGLTDFVSDSDLSIKDVTLKPTDNKFLDIIPSGTIPPNPAELLMSDRIDYLFETVKNEYDYIIVDTAAVGLVTDTLLISNHADMFLYVVSANNVDKRQLHIAQTMYDEKRLPNMAVVLNGTIKKKGYGYGYGNNPERKKKKFFGII